MKTLLVVFLSAFFCINAEATKPSFNDRRETAQVISVDNIMMEACSVAEGEASSEGIKNICAKVVASYFEPKLDYGDVVKKLTVFGEQVNRPVGRVSMEREYNGTCLPGDFDYKKLNCQFVRMCVDNEINESFCTHIIKNYLKTKDPKLDLIFKDYKFALEKRKEEISYLKNKYPDDAETEFIFNLKKGLKVKCAQKYPMPVIEQVDQLSLDEKKEILEEQQRVKNKMKKDPICRLVVED